jgi:hypothetical protein
VQPLAVGSRHVDRLGRHLKGETLGRTKQGGFMHETRKRDFTKKIVL